MRMARSNISGHFSSLKPLWPQQASIKTIPAADATKKNTVLGEQTVLFRFSTNYLKIFPMS